MPELPEVETVRSDLQQRVTGLSVNRIEILDSRVIRHAETADFSRRMQGQVIAGVQRRGKALIFLLHPSDEFLVVQLMMTGQLIVSSRPAVTKQTKIVFHLSSSRYLQYNDQRLFGRLQVAGRLADVHYLQVLGPEPFDRKLTASWMQTRLARRRSPVKTVLLDHTFVAGIGNIYASEILFRARIHPSRPAYSLTAAEVGVLHHAMKQVLREAIRWRGTSMHTYRDGSGEKGKFMQRIRVYGRTDKPCVHCRQRIVRMVQSGRSTFFCGQCQN